MKTKEQIIKDQESIGNIQITGSEYDDTSENGVMKIFFKDGGWLYFKPKPEDKRVFENNSFRIKIMPCGMEIYDKYEAQNIELNVSIPLLLESIKEAERQGLWNTTTGVSHSDGVSE
jgi:hypothetical protein